MSPVYLDCCATTPVDPEVGETFRHYLEEEFGNEGSRTHLFGAQAKRAVQVAREQIARLVACRAEEIVFTSGATESNNLAILGLAEFGERSRKRHIITTSLEHKAVLEPLEEMERRGFDITRIQADSSGRISPNAVARALREDTFLVSMMQVNNETGIRQPVHEVAEVLGAHPAYFHTDAAQGFGKDLVALKNPRIDLTSVSGHKLFAPKGIGALAIRRRGISPIPLRPLMFGGGQQKGIRPGTLPVALIASLGKAAELAARDHVARERKCADVRRAALEAFAPLKPRYTGDQAFCLQHVVNLAFPGLDSEALIVATKDLVAISNGSACTSTSYAPSHVLKAMGMADNEANECVRLSWCHLTPEVDWTGLAGRIATLR